MPVDNTAVEIRAALERAGVEVFREDDSGLFIAERVRLHLMDSGVRVCADETPRVEFIARCQESDCGPGSDGELLDFVRSAVGSAALARGFAEAGACRKEIRDPMDDERVLDVWHQVTYAKPAPNAQDVVQAVRWALDLEKCVTAV